MTPSIRRKPLAVAIGALALAFAGSTALGAGFALQENSGSGLGNAFAGGAASAEDASTIWANPAGMSKLKTPEAAAAIHFINVGFKFKDNGSQPAAFQPLGNTGGDAGSLNIVPNLFISYPVTSNVWLGLGVNAPFGLVTEYSNDWLGRFQGIKSDVKTYNVNPSIAWQVAPNFSIGAGVDWQRVDAEFTSAFNYSAGIAQGAQQAAAAGLIPATAVPGIIAATPGLNAGVRVKADDSAWGWNIGFLWDISQQTRLGAHYRSSIKYKATGDVSFDIPALPTLPPTLAPVVGLIANGVNAQLANGGITSDIELPDIANVSLFSRLNDRWDVMGDIQFTRWSSIKDLTFVRTTGVELLSTPENFDDTWRFAVGANYRPNGMGGPWTLRGGVAWDQSPVNNVDRTPRLPDGDRLWLSLGAQYKLDRNWKFDGGFTYIFIDDPKIDQNAGNQARFGLIKGTYDANVMIFSGQVTYTF